MQKLVAFLYTNNELSEREVKGVPAAVQQVKDMALMLLQVKDMALMLQFTVAAQV